VNTAATAGTADAAGTTAAGTAAAGTADAAAGTAAAGTAAATAATADAAAAAAGTAATAGTATAADLAPLLLLLANGGDVKNPNAGLANASAMGNASDSEVDDTVRKDMTMGGNVNGAGTPTSDSIPAALSDGEYVLNANTVKMVGKPFLDKLNAKGLKERYGANQLNKDSSAVSATPGNVVPFKAPMVAKPQTGVPMRAGLATVGKRR
jgi:hypothetical protein